MAEAFAVDATHGARPATTGSDPVVAGQTPWCAPAGRLGAGTICRDVRPGTAPVARAAAERAHDRAPGGAAGLLVGALGGRPRPLRVGVRDLRPGVADRLVRR